MHLENLGAAGQVRVRHRDLAVEAAGAQQRRVQDVRAVRRRDEDDALAAGEAVHLHQQLVQGLLALVVAAAHAGAALAAHRVDLVDEDDARAVLARLLEQVAHTRGADADEHFHEVRAGDGVERHAGLARHGAGEQGLTGAGRAVQQHAARDLRAQLLVHGGVGEEVHHLVQLVHGLVRASHVRERVGRVVFGQLLGLGAADAEWPAAAGLQAVHEEEDQAEDQDHRQHEAQHGHQEGLLRHIRLVLVRARIPHSGEDVWGGARGVLGGDGLHALALVHGDRLAQVDAHALLAVVDLHFFRVLVLQLLKRHRGVNPLVGAGIVPDQREQVEDDERDGANHAPPQDLCIFAHKPLF